MLNVDIPLEIAVYSVIEKYGEKLGPYLENKLKLSSLKTEVKCRLIGKRITVSQ